MADDRDVSICRWRWVRDYEGRYMVSDSGIVARVLSPHARRRYRNGQLRSTHLRVALCGKKVKPEPRWIHRMVLEAFVGPCPDGYEACHDNDVGSDNRLANIRWDTKSENRKDVWRIGLRNGTKMLGKKLQRKQRLCRCGHRYLDHSPACCSCGCSRAYPPKVDWSNHVRGERHPDAKVSEKQVLEIVNMSGRGQSDRAIALVFGVGRGVVRGIRNGSTWKHVTRLAGASGNGE